MKPSNGVYLAFGPFRFDPVSGLLFEEGVEVALPPRASALLAGLLESPGEMVSKEELIEAVWGDTAVSDQSLTEAIKLLRQALHDDPKNPVYIHTLRGRGYRFIAEVSTVPRNGAIPENGRALENEAVAEKELAPTLIDVGSARRASLRRWTRRLALGTAALVIVAVGGTLLVWTWLTQNTDRLARLEQLVATLLGSGIQANLVWRGDAEFSGSVSPDGGYIAYVSPGESPQLWLRERTTGGRIQLTRHEWPLTVHRDGRAVFSRDGQRIAYVVWDWATEVAEMHVRTLEDVTAAGDSLAIADTGSNGDSAPSNGDPDAPGGDEISGDVDHRVIFRGEEGEFVVAHDWTLDGRSVFAALKTDAGVEIVRISAERGLEAAPPYPITALAGDEDPYSNGPRKISLSPDGLTIAYDVAQLDGSGYRDIHTLSLVDWTKEVVVEHPWNDHSPLWTPDGGRLLFVSNREGNYRLWTVPFANGQAAEPAADLKTPGHGWNVRPLGLTTDGSLYYGSGADLLGKDIWIARLEAGTFKKAGEPDQVFPAVPGQNLFPAWSPDGRLLAHVAERGQLFDHDAVVVIDSVNGNQVSKRREIPPPLRQIRQMRWSPDGGSILVKAIDPEGVAGIHLIDPATGEAEVLVRGGLNSANLNFPRWSSDGNAVFYWRRTRVAAPNAGDGEDRAWVERILRHSLSSPDAAGDLEIYRVDSPAQVRWIDLSPDGEQIGVYLETPNGNTSSLSIRIMPASGATEGKEAWSRSEGNWRIREFVWTPDGKGMLFVRRTSSTLQENRELWKLDLASGTTEPIEISMPGLQRIALDPEGRRIAFAASTQAPSADVWVLRNFLDSTATGGGR